MTGWGWDDVLPLFRKSEHHFGGENANSTARAANGMSTQPRITWDLLDAFADAAREAGIPSTEDFNRGDNEGCGYFQVNQKNGRRLSAAHAFLKPALKRPNLTLITGALADRILFEGKRATGVLIRQRMAQQRNLTARREVILSAGAVATPAILERSGIGDGQRLRELGVPLVHHAPGVGENLQDHLQLRLIFKVTGARTMNMDYRSLFKRAGMALDYALRRRGPLTMAPSQLGAFTRSSARLRDAQSAIPHPAAVAGQIRRCPASVPGLHGQRREFAAHQPRLDPCAQPRCRATHPSS